MNCGAQGGPDSDIGVFLIPDTLLKYKVNDFSLNITILKNTPPRMIEM
jgi:hypothetical protein